MALALARRYRPRRFTDLLVQDHVAAVLRAAVVNNRVGHGYLLTGPRGVGKTTAARILAMALNCERKTQVDPPGEPCGECPSCLRIWNGSANLDVVEIDAASNRGVDDARDLRERAMYAASQEGGHKVYIVDEAHMLTREAWNALLKILEEPPPGVVFVFATTEPQKIAQTASPVLSRLQRFDFRRIGPGVIRQRLREVLALEKIAADEDALTLISRHADGGMRDALSILDQCLSFGEGAVTAQRVRDILGLVDDELYSEVLALVVERRPAGVFGLVDRLLSAGADLVEFVGGTAEMLRALLMLQVGAEPEGLTEGMRQTLGAYQSRLEPGDILRMLKLIAENETGIRRSGNTRLQVETLLLRCTMMDRMVDLQSVLAGGTLEAPAPIARPVSGPPKVTAPARSPSAQPRGAEADSPPPTPTVPAALEAAAPVEPIPFSLESLLERWGEIIAAAREQSRFLGEAIAATRPLSAAAPRLTIVLEDENPMHRESLLRQREAIEALVGRRVGGMVKLEIGGPAPEAGGEPAARPRRLSDGEAKLERLRAMKGKDPALEALAGELDFEVLE